MAKSKSKAPKSSDVPTSIRLTSEMLAGIDAAQAQIDAERPGQKVGRADTIRALLAEALTNRKITIK